MAYDGVRAVNGLVQSFLVAGLLSVLPLTSAGAAAEESDAGLTGLFVHYYTALEKGRWAEAFDFLHDRLKAASEVKTPEDLARRNTKTQQDLIEAFQTFDRIEVAKTTIDLTSIKARVMSSGDENVAGEVIYDLVVFPKGKGQPLTYRVVMDIGLAKGQIIRMTQQSMTRIDPGGMGESA
ncbi:MAG: hypothetical protein E6K60_04820 [Nitrospirae bacterium]|nr:MAG: hypothetical protein E6K60_04820 [Nitrospirota bacterium]